VVPEVPEDAIVPGCTLSELGLNSIDRVEVVTLTMEELAISVPVHEFHREATIEALVGVLRRHA
jgi:polyketide biosynthesis acyl carrier protein